MIKNRSDIKDFIIALEEKYPVNEWQLNGFYFWPIIKIRLFFFLIRKVEYDTTIVASSSAKTKSKTTNKIVSKLNNLFAVVYAPFWLARLPKKKHLFIAQDAHRVDYKGKRFNRFFDVLIQQYGLEDDSMYFEKIQGERSTIEHGKNIFNYDKALKAFVKKYRMKSKKNLLLFESASYRDFLKDVSDTLHTEEFGMNFTEKRLSKWYARTVLPKIAFFNKILKKVHPKQVTILCYYSENTMLLLAAAHELGIKTVEMQHGPQSPLHLCYASWNRIPDTGYQVLPRNYWCWDEASNETISYWASATKHYKAVTTGNPWIDFWKEKQLETSDTAYILYSLQPKPVALAQLFSDPIIKLIKTSNHTWYIRLHPRQLQDINTIRDFLNEKGVSDKINIDKASVTPLPQLLANAKLHVTQYSGTVIEASQMQMKTVLLHPIGNVSFQELINTGRAIYLNPNAPDFIENFESVLHNAKKNELTETRYSTVKDLF